MNEPMATGGGTQTNAGGAGNQTGGVPSLTTQQMMEKLGGILGADAECINEQERWRVCLCSRLFRLRSRVWCRTADRSKLILKSTII